MNSRKINFLFFFLYGQKDRGQLTPESLQGERRRDLLSSPSPSALLPSWNNMILRESRHCSTSFCFLCQSRFEWTPWLHFCFPFTVKVFFSVSLPHCHYGHSILFLPVVNLTYCQVLISGFGGLTTTPI